MFGLGVPELIIILVVVLLIFGPRKLPELGSFVGKSLRDFRDALEARDDSDDHDTGSRTATHDPDESEQDSAPRDDRDRNA